MASNSIIGLYIHKINTGAPRILERVKATTSHTKLLARIGESKAIEPRNLLHCVNEIRGEAIQLHHDLTFLAEMRGTVRRRHLGNEFGAFASNFQGAVKRVGVEFDKMDVAIRDLEKVATYRINDPSRWGDAAAAGPVTGLMSLLSQFLELWGLLRVRRKLDA